MRWIVYSLPLVLAAQMCGNPAAARWPDAGSASTSGADAEAAPADEPMIQRDNRKLRNLKRNLQKKADQRPSKIDDAIKRSKE